MRDRVNQLSGVTEAPQKVRGKYAISSWKLRNKKCAECSHSWWLHMKLGCKCRSPARCRCPKFVRKETT